MDQNLANLLAKKRQQSGAVAQVDWDKRRDEYLKAVDDLYKRISAILAEPLGKKEISETRRSKVLTENYIGTYSVEDLVLVIGSEQVRFSPRGRNIAGAEGRVDVIGEKNEAMLIFQPQAGGWGFVQSRQPKLSVIPLDESSLADVLQGIMRD
jgi:hypothetical protein